MKIKKIQRKLIPIVIAILVTAITMIVIINKKENNSYKDNKIEEVLDWLHKEVHM